MPIIDRLFAVSDNAIEHILLADESDDEDNLPLDEEDLGFLGEDSDNVGVEIIIERPIPELSLAGPSSTPQPFSSVKSKLIPTSVPPAIISTLPSPDDPPEAKRSKRHSKIIPSKDIKFTWKPRKSHFQMKKIDYEYGAVNLDVDLSLEPSAYDVFRKACGFDELVALIVQQSELYMKQKGISFHTTAEEISAFLGMNCVMGYHVVPSFRDYWSSDPDMQVPYIANIMSRRRFEVIRNALHLANNEDMLPRNHPNYDRAFKVRPLIKHFNQCFQNARKPSKQQSIDEHMIRFKGHNIMKQYIKSKPIKWGFKMWCRCDSNSGYLYQFDLYTGKKTDPEYGLGEGVVTLLTLELSDEPVLDTLE
ncbi:piggyBac transposable element-derived protein 3-like [Ischnura elegans]|uniref:piggyBac transposable element-derived protein 3-like n=1 Tax=Ischnura elegans TaxID=197161 RepID=UPI001ED880BB|nr:piggyBac transposable element-derived protein 3-like [Ischnura elegans]